MIDANPAASGEHAKARASYDIFGERIVVESSDEAIAARVAAAWRPFRAADSADPCAVFHLTRRDGESPVQRGQQFHSGTLLTIADRYKLITASLGAMPWQIHLEAFGQSAEYAYYYLFEPLLLMVLKRRNLIHRHAAAVSRRGKIVLIVGDSGSGKSTTTLSLVLNGYTFVADDDLFLVRQESGVGVRSVERALHFTEATAQLVGGVPGELPLVQRGKIKKRRFAIAGSPANTDDAHVGVVLFPRVGEGAASALSALPVAETMRRLMLQPPKQYPAVVRDVPSLEHQFAACADLAKGARSFELTLGKDVASVAALVDEVIG